MSQVDGAKFVKDFQLTFNGVNLIGKIKHLSPVNVKSDFEKIRPGGVEGMLAVRTGLSELELSFTVYGYEEGILVKSGLHQAGAFTEVAMNWVIEDQYGVKTPVLIEAQGPVTNLDRGSIENGTLGEVTVTMTLHRYKEEYNGETIYDIDVYSGSRLNIIGGVDVAKQTIDILRQVGASV